MEPGLRDPLLVSVHLPKTGGTSFCVALRHHFGDQLLLDYARRPLHQRHAHRTLTALRDGAHARGRLEHVRAVHGHFLPIKYRIAAGPRQACYATWLRDPVARLLSHYEFWRRTPAAATPQQPLRQRFHRERWSLERFCLGPELRNLYQRWFWGFDPRRFAFVGITERYAEDLERFASAYLGGVATYAHERTNPGHGHGGGYDIDVHLRRRIETHHADDMRLYRWALVQREQRATDNGPR